MSIEDHPENILVVDDTAENRQVLVQLLQGEGFHVRAASTGRLAIMSCDAEPPDLILLDVTMPEMNGFEVCRQLKSKDRLKRVPIIFLSARTDTTDKVAGFDAGGVDYITKPFEPTETLSRVRTHLRIAQLRSQLESMNNTLEERVAERTRDLEQSMERLRQAEKMELVGRLAGGVAHDFNNLLTTILGNVELSRRRLGRESPIKRNLDDIELAATRSADLTHQLLAFARKQVIQPRCVDLNVCVSEAERLLRRTLGEHIQLEFSPGSDRPMVLVDPGQICQVIINMGVNARDAMPKGGRMTLSTRIETLDKNAAKEFPDLQPGRFAVLSVSDTGAGISEENQKRIFEPFFTTKQSGKGTGLGLATCYGIVKQHNGQISVRSQLGSGSTFFVYLPICENADVIQEQKDVAVLPAIEGTPTILLCEDDKMVREVIEAVLVAMGYNVLVAKSGDEALVLAKESKTPIQLLITDLVMPEMTGLELEQRLRENLARVKVLLITGYSEEAIANPGAFNHTRQLLQKPFSPADLFEKVRTMIED